MVARELRAEREDGHRERAVALVVIDVARERAVPFVSRADRVRARVGVLLDLQVERAVAAWIAQGLNPKRIQALMGHASIQQTFDRCGYLSEAREDELKAMAAVENGLLR